MNDDRMMLVEQCVVESVMLSSPTGPKDAVRLHFRIDRSHGEFANIKLPWFVLSRDCAHLLKEQLEVLLSPLTRWHGALNRGVCAALHRSPSKGAEPNAARGSTGT
jgi:hypothetical protein